MRVASQEEVPHRAGSQIGYHEVCDFMRSSYEIVPYTVPYRTVPYTEPDRTVLHRTVPNKDVFDLLC